VCRKVGAQKLVLAHTRDDQAETVLMRLLRGSGLYGLSAIQPKLSLDGIEVVRPFIDVGKDEILKVARSMAIDYRIDASNSDETFLRNKIRSRLLPLLENEYNPNIREVLAGMAASIGADYAYMAREAEVFFERHAVMRKGRCCVELPALRSLDISLRRLALRLALERVKGDLRRVSFKHLNEAEDLIISRRIGSLVHLPGGLTIKKTLNCLVILKR
jgi:tRNA(Ile)-lysidine synthase